MPKRSRSDFVSDLDDQSSRHPQPPVMHVLGKRPNTICEYEKKKRARTDEYTMKLENRIAKLEQDMIMLRTAMEMAGHHIFITGCKIFYVYE